MSQLASIIEKAADAFALSIIAAVKAATLQELLAMQGATEAAPARRRGRPPKAKPGRKPGRPANATGAKATAKKIAKKAAMTSANKKRSINYPKCSVPGCGKNRYAKGNGMCGDHFKAAQAEVSA
jgi:hypothetical protein